MKLLITSSNPTTLWELEDSTVKQLVFRDFSCYDLYPCTVKLTNRLPPELGEKVVTFLFWEYIRLRCFDQAVELAQISKYYIQKFYNLLYKKPHDDLMDMYKRISRTFLFCEAVDDYFVTPRTGSYSTCLRVLRPGIVYPTLPLRPWDFGKYYTSEPLTSVFYSGTQRINEYYIGPHTCDTIWVNGTTTSGIMDAVEIYYPVLNLILSDASDNVLPTALTMKRNQYLKSFIDLLKIIYGKGIVINFMIKEDDNPFVVTTDSFISI